MGRDEFIKDLEEKFERERRRIEKELGRRAMPGEVLNPKVRKPVPKRDTTRRSFMRIGTIIAIVVVVLALFGGVVTSCVGCSNPETPAGQEGYLRQGAIFGSAHYYGSQVGPTSSGLTWLLSVENVDFKWRTIDEEFEVQSSDNISLHFKAHITIRPKPGEVKTIVETYGGNDWYTRFLSQPIRNAVYDAVAKEKALDAKDKRDQIAVFVDKRVRDLIAGKPFEVQRVVIGAVNFPKELVDAQNKKVASETLLAQKQFEIDIAKQDAVKRVEEAKGIAEAQKIIDQSLTERYLQHEAIGAQKEMANGQNHTTVYIPSGANGIPLVKNL